MASDITTSASFATANMKPAADEQIDALWGQNIADNTGYNLYRRLPGPNFHFIVQSNFTSLKRWESMSTARLNRRQEFGSFSGSFYFHGVTDATAGTATYFATVLLNGVVVANFATVWDASSSPQRFATGSFSYNTTSLTHNTDYDLVVVGSKSVTGGVNAEVRFDAWTWQDK